MPAPIDHDQRRRLIAEVATDLLARQGLEALTMRQVAEAAGFSTGAVTHYFKSKKDLLLFTYQWASDQSRARVEAALQRDPDDLIGLLEALAYVDAPRYWRVYFAFWQIALVDPDFMAEQARRTESARAMLLDLFQRWARAGRAVPVDPVRAARDLVLVVQGLGLQSILHDDDWTRDGKRAFLAGQIRHLLPDPTGVSA